MAISTQSASFGDLLKDWRRRRRLSQLDLALAADVSTRHVSFLETGRAQPSRDMIARLSDVLEAPLGARNTLLEAAGFAPAYPRRPLEAEALAPVRAALERMMANHAPYPAILFSRRWDILDANPAGRALLGAAEPGANVIELFADHPEMRALVLNWADVAQAFLVRLTDDSRRAGGDTDLDALAARLADTIDPHDLDAPTAAGDPFIPVRLRAGDGTGELSFLTAVVEINGAQELTVSDLHLELYFPANPQTAQAFEGAAAALA